MEHSASANQKQKLPAYKQYFKSRNSIPIQEHLKHSKKWEATNAY